MTPEQVKDLQGDSQMDQGKSQKQRDNDTRMYAWSFILFVAIAAAYGLYKLGQMIINWIYNPIQ